MSLWKRRELLMSKLPEHIRNPNRYSEPLRLPAQIENVSDFIERMIGK